MEKINKDFEKALHYVTSDNPEKAIPILNQIHKEGKAIGYQHAVTRVGHTLAIIYFNSSDYDKVINLDDGFLKVGEEIKDYEKMSHIYRLKACAYSELGVLKKAKDVYASALEYANKIEPGNGKQHALGVIYGNLASLFIKSGAPQDSIFASIEKSIAAADKITETDNLYISKKYSLIAYSYMILANEYLKSGNQQLAGTYYQKAYKIHNTQPVPLVEKVVLLNELGYFYSEQKDYEKAVEYAELGLAMEKKASFPQLRKVLFESLSKSYLELQKTEDSKKYFELFTALNDSINKNDRSALSSTIIKQEKQYKDKAEKQSLIYALLSVGLIVLVVVFFLYYKKKKQKQIQKIKSILKQLEEQHHDNKNDVSVSTIIEKIADKEEEIALMPPEAEEKLLEKLSDFEKEKHYLERKVSLPYVAAAIETNTKYLSYIIKKHKGKDFNKYINDLRIDYIVRKLNDNPTYRHYKINVLAEEAGFSSHSKFATVFKAYVGSSPSEFIKYLQ
ncbi:helix-turn-helix domain-containing protein [Soonwooa purpurea]